VIVATRSLLAYRATPETGPVLPHCDSYQLRSFPIRNTNHEVASGIGGRRWKSGGSVSMRTKLLEAIQERYRGATRSEKQRMRPSFFSIAGYHRKRAIRRRFFDGAGGLPWTSIAPCSVSSRTSRGEAPADVGASGGVDKQQDAGVAMWTFSQRPPGQHFVTVAVVSGRIGRHGLGLRHPEQLTAERQLPGTMTIAEEAEVADALKPVRQHMDQGAADEFSAVQTHHLLPITMCGCAEWS
jgi:hypothetical protein